MTHGLDRRAFLTSLLALVLARCAQIKIPGMPGGGGDSAGSGDLAGTADQFQKFVSFGTKNLLIALSKVGLAVGRKEEAAHYAAAADTITSGSMSGDDFTKKNKLIDTSSFKPADLQKIHSAEARGELTNSFIHFTIASFADKKASSAAEKLVTAVPTPAEIADGTVSGAIAVARTASGALPHQVATAGQWLNALRAYMKANNMKLPSAADAKKVAEAQGMQPTLLADFPTNTSEAL